MTSSSPTPTPYLGSKISLISKSEIRYEGILYTVDTKESTIALAKVKSFGTEDRPTEHPVAARDEVYEYIIFKASDIKDLMVCETPKQVSCLVGGLPSDPAIVQISSSQSSHGPSSNSIFPSSLPIKAPVQSKSISSTRAHQGTDAGVQTGQKKEVQSTGENRRPAQPQQQRHFQQQFHRDMFPPPFARGFRPPFPPMPGNFRPFGGRDGERGQARFPMPPGFHRGFYPDRRMFPAPWGQGPFGPPRRGFQAGRGGPQQRGDRPQRLGATLKFDGDYDFEENNQKFLETLDKLAAVKITGEKNEGEAEGEKVVEEVAEEAGEEGEVIDSKSYDKAKSFFDAISCEAAERAEAKPNDRTNWGRQRDRNQETFGQMTIGRYGNGFRRYDMAPFRDGHRFRS